MPNKQDKRLLEKLGACADYVNDWEDVNDFSWWQPVFDLLDLNDEVVKTRFARIQVRYALSELRRRRGS
jgi:hypothetical protein